MAHVRSAEVGNFASSSLLGRACRFLDRDDCGIICRTDGDGNSRLILVVTLRPDGSIGVYVDIPECRLSLEPIGSESERYIRAGVRAALVPLLTNQGRG